MRFETEDAAERRLVLFWLQHPNRMHYQILRLGISGRYTGLITGVSDVDPVRWRGSKWRSLLVCICSNGSVCSCLEKVLARMCIFLSYG